MQVQLGSKVLDVGCGAGADTVPLAQCVGPTGQVVGIDLDQTMLEEAECKARLSGVSAWTRHMLSDVVAMPFVDNTFDACHAERVFVHLEQPELSLSEMLRVTRPGGTVVVVDVDGGLMLINSPEVELERKLASYSAKRFTNGYVGRQMFALFKRQKMTDVAVHLMPTILYDLPQILLLTNIFGVLNDAKAEGFVTENEAGRFRECLEDAHSGGTLFCCLTQIATVGRKLSVE